VVVSRVVVLKRRRIKRSVRGLVMNEQVRGASKKSRAEGSPSGAAK
jgi:hypothetical protein